MTILITNDISVEAPASELWKYVRAYGRMHEYCDFVDNTTMNDVEPAVGVLRVVESGGRKLDETITEWNEEMMSYTFGIKNGPPFAETIYFTLRVEEVDDKTSKFVCVTDLKMTWFFSWVLPSFLVKKKIGGKQMEMLKCYKNATETNMPV
jgi:hypothetical protein